MQGLNENELQEKLIAASPKCPHCSAQPISVENMPQQMGILRTIVFFCHDCKNIISVDLFGVDMPTQPSPESLIVPGVH